jgi:hypothetical protein
MHAWLAGRAGHKTYDTLLILVAFSSGINAIATGALIDMHTMKGRTKT